jgi:hypothetical protein
MVVRAFVMTEAAENNAVMLVIMQVIAVITMWIASGTVMVHTELIALEGAMADLKFAGTGLAGRGMNVITTGPSLPNL